MVSFPAPIGGKVASSDFAPSILFVVLYGLLLPLVAYRMVHRSSRTFLLLNSALFCIERVVLFSLRARQAHRFQTDAAAEISRGLTVYTQLSFGTGFIGLTIDLVGLLRCLLLNPTYGSDTWKQSPQARSHDYDDYHFSQSDNSGLVYNAKVPGNDLISQLREPVPPPPPGTPDQPVLRMEVRKWCGLCSLAFLGGATVTSIVAGSWFSKGFDNQKKADGVQVLRYISTIVALALSTPMAYGALWAYAKLPRVHRLGCAILLLLLSFTSVVGVYRLSVMRFRTDSLQEPGPLSTPASKAAFYLFHIVPEWLFIVTLFSINVRRIFGTGIGGDIRSKDETEKERRKREEKYAKRRQKWLTRNGGHVEMQPQP